VSLLVHVAGVYGCFLTWGVLQERLSTMKYSHYDNVQLTGQFKFFVFINCVQAFVSCFVALVSMIARGINFQITSPRLWWDYLGISISQSIASPFGYASLKHINFPTLILGKSCKLVPVMFMNILVYGKKFEWYKYFTVAMITVGVSGFMLFDEDGDKKKSGSNSWYGLLLIFINLMLDGLTFSWQDLIFKNHQVSSFHMMFYMNFFIAIGNLLWSSGQFAIPGAGVSIGNGQLFPALQFLQNYDLALRDLLLFALCGALGQVFIFSLLENFGSLTLTTVTVTRKLFTVLLSLFWFNHKVVPLQWAFVAIVFTGILLEGFMKFLFEGKTKPQNDKSKGETQLNGTGSGTTQNSKQKSKTQ
jgi:UDP-galactose transporter B1